MNRMYGTAGANVRTGDDPRRRGGWFLLLVVIAVAVVLVLAACGPASNTAPAPTTAPAPAPAAPATTPPCERDGLSALPDSAFCGFVVKKVGQDIDDGELDGLIPVTCTSTYEYGMPDKTVSWDPIVQVAPEPGQRWLCP